MSFDFCTSPNIVYGRGAFDRLGTFVAGFGSRAMVVRGGGHLDDAGVIDRLKAQLGQRGVQVTFHEVHGEPDVSSVDAALEVAREADAHVVVGLGGGSVIDTAKAVAGLLALSGEALDYLEVVGGGLSIDRPAVPLIAVPTTAGTGTEVTRNAVIAYKPRNFKASMRSPFLIPRVALVDPALTDTVPRDVTASTGLDALTQLIEPYVSNRANPLTDGIALQGIALAVSALPRVVRDGADQAARDDMALASLMGGICLANAGLGAVHGFAAPLGASFPVPHGVACAALLVPVMQANVAALREAQPDSPTLLRYARVLETLTSERASDPSATIDVGIARVAALVDELQIPRLGTYGLREEHIDALVARANRSSSMRYNPIALSDAALAGCLRAAL